jgi:predicted nuclease with TOPRIM domain
MDTQTSQMLFDLIPQGGFAGFLLYLYLTQKKDIKELNDQYRADRDTQKKEEDKIRNDYRNQESQLRNRYDAVITSLNLEKENFRSALYDEIGKLTNRVSDLEKSLAGLIQKMEFFADKIDDFRKK